VTSAAHENEKDHYPVVDSELKKYLKVIGIYDKRVQQWLK